MTSTRDIIKKYEKKIESELKNKKQSYSREYSQFKQEMLPEMTRYKRWTEALGNIVKINLAEKDRTKTQGYLNTAHIDVTPEQALTLSIISLILSFFGVVSIILGWFFVTGEFQVLLLFLGLIASLFVFYYTYTMPKRLANSWRMKASSQMVPAILYVVVYMKHTSNLERAIEFASQHLEIPLALDFRKIIYDVEIGKYSTIKQSLDTYLENWEEYAPEFVEAFHLIESSLFEPSETRRVQILEKALQVILDGVYEKMLKYTREIRSPLTNIYMLGIILPTLGLALLPLASALLQGLVQWQHIFVIFNIIVPFFVFYMTSEILFKRPGGHGESSVLELNPDYPKYASKKPWITAFIIALPLLLLGMLPFIFQVSFITSSLGLQSDYTFQELGIPFFEQELLFDFKDTGLGRKVGPFGLPAVLLSMFIPLSIALFFALTYRKKTKEMIKARDSTKSLEKEFTNSLFQLGNRIGDGTPAELVFGKVAQSTQGQKTQKFFLLVDQNIKQAGMSIEKAIFDKKRGAIIYFPSALISTSMKILIESVKKGLQVAARSLMSISEYVKNINRITERLRDLLAEIVSDMKSNMTFLAPLLAGIVVGLSSMIALILNRLTLLSNLVGDTSSVGQGFAFASITELFDITSVIPPYYMQLAIGIYIVEIIFILTTALVTVDSGKDPLKTKYDLSKNLLRGTALYLIASIVTTITLSVLAIVALGGLI
ncbi:hypothetical protein AUJ63_02765 [Candidatus Pacearchaeota archaeon CG1_02_35_32]|nr:MAG: hypothetical protein AUJ63_02765 [Candidatus Pacearchaeota archaeon CG1_02_35_32]